MNMCIHGILLRAIQLVAASEVVGSLVYFWSFTCSPDILISIGQGICLWILCLCFSFSLTILPVDILMAHVPSLFWFLLKYCFVRCFTESIYLKSAPPSLIQSKNHGSLCTFSSVTFLALLAVCQGMDSRIRPLSSNQERKEEEVQVGLHSTITTWYYILYVLCIHCPPLLSTMRAVTTCYGCSLLWAQHTQHSGT